MRKHVLVLAFVVATAVAAPPGDSAIPFPFQARSLDGNANNVAHPSWGRAGTTGSPVNYLRIGPVNYANGIERMQPGPNVRYVSNRIFNDISQNIFSERDESQWGWAW